MDKQPSSIIPLSRIEIEVDPKQGDLWTGPVPIISGHHFRPLKEITLVVSCQDAYQRSWKSRNNFLVSANGIFDTSATAAVGDGYYGISVEGPFYSMVCNDEGQHDFAWHGLQTLTYQLSCFDGEKKIWSHQVTRELGLAHKSRVAQPTAAVLYFDDEIISDESEVQIALAAYGIRVWDGTLRPQVGDAHSLWPSFQSAALPRYVIGSGRASARALEAAIRLEGLSGVILFSGGGLRFDPIQGVKRDEAGNLAITDLDYAHLDHSKLRPRTEGVLSTRSMYADAVANRSNRERGRIEVEKVRCPIFMFSGLDDQIWPASAFSELIVQRRKRTSCPYPSWHRTFEGVGHDLGPSLGLPTFPTSERTIHHPDTGFRLLLGGKPGRQARARRECWDTMVSILAGEHPE